MENMNTPDPHHLIATIMPLVRLMGRSGLSWSVRQDCAAEISECLRHHKSMTDELEWHRSPAARDGALPPVNRNP